MGSQEEGFLRAIEEGDWFSVGVYADWLEEQGREEREFWRWVGQVKVSPEEDHNPTFYIGEEKSLLERWEEEGGRKGTAYTWWEKYTETDQRVGRIAADLLASIPRWDMEEYELIFREFPTVRAAYQGLYKGWKLLKESKNIRDEGVPEVLAGRKVNDGDLGVGAESVGNKV